ncbi:MAG: hypothetical protein LKF82_08655 [Acinetobacter populi]|uniref:hypothetical protein n=1 Tax=Acinetobacter populi TaxID=1582270 RepID=UPI002357D40A|nr:hypothetical protein [Acinetobacter populi]MCH4247894.1 hypothetical protein [Acinetobacter populi]
MNKHKLKDFLQETLEPHGSTFQDTSFDKENKEYLCQDRSTQPVYNFDAYIDARFGQGKGSASPDAIYIGKKQLYFVEFKNEKVSDLDKKQLEKKFEKGTDILREMLKDFTPRDCQYFFCIVHKPQQKAKYFNPVHIQESTLRSKLEELNKEQNGFYDKVFVNDVDFYKQQFPQLEC